VKLSDFADRVIPLITRCDPARVVPKMERPRAPITAGAAGVALFLAEVARAGDGASRERAAEQALAWVTAAERTLRYPQTAFGFPGYSFKRSFGGLGVFHGRAGVHTVAARVASVRGEIEALRAAAIGFVNAWRAACTREDFPTEVFFGCAGFIHAARDFDAHADALGPVLSERVRSVGSEAHARMCESFARLARRALPQGMLLGYAHGLAGELDVVLAWDPRPSPVVAAVLDQLLALAVVEDELAAWPVRVGDEVGDLWASWCNGMAGHVYLWCRAYEVFRDERYLTAARLSAQTTAVLCPPNPSVCCGTAGQAYALHRYFRLTSDPAYRRLAVARARRACAQAAAESKMTLAYFGGLSGVAHLAFTLHARRTPCLPLIDGLPGKAAKPA
jgi:serine/threonine-protein kinase